MHSLRLPLATLLSGVALLVTGVGLLFPTLGLRAGLLYFAAVAAMLAAYTLHRMRFAPR